MYSSMILSTLTLLPQLLKNKFKKWAKYLHFLLVHGSWAVDNAKPLQLWTFSASGELGCGTKAQGINKRL